MPLARRAAIQVEVLDARTVSRVIESNVPISCQREISPQDRHFYRLEAGTKERGEDHSVREVYDFAQREGKFDFISSSQNTKFEQVIQ